MRQELSNIQSQSLGLEQTQRLTARQVAYMRMLEMPVEDLRERVEKELEENVALERADEGAEGAEGDEQQESVEDLDREERASAEEGDFTEMSDRDTLDEIEYFESERPQRRSSGGDSDETTFDDPDTPQFRDTLMAQVGEYTLTEHQRELLEYLIGSLDDDGLLKKKLYVIADELEVYMGITATTDELEEALGILQQFDPAGIGAQSLQQTLLLQIDRRVSERPDSRLWPQLRLVVANRWDELTNNRWDIIRQRMRLGEGEARSLQRMLRTLTPSPGLAPGESMSPKGGGTSIVADFIVDIDTDGKITVSLNEPGMPTLRVSPEYGAMASRPAAETPGRTQQEKRQSHDYVRASVMRANSFLLNLRGRQETLLRIMREVVSEQRDYLMSGDEAQLHTLTMKEVAERLDMDLSIVSRAASGKWADTPHGMRQVRWFFRNVGGVKAEDGTQLEQDRLVQAVAQAIENEDKRHPLSDEKLTRQLQAAGYPIARRTVAKYREMLNIPVARLRQQH